MSEQIEQAPEAPETISEKLDAETLYEKELPMEDGSFSYIRVFNSPEGFILAVETEDGAGAILDLSPEFDEAVDRANGLVTAFEEAYENSELEED